MQRGKNAGRTQVKRRAWVLRQVLSIAALFGFATAAFSQGVITTVAGTDWLFPDNGGPALNAPLSETFGLDLAVDGSGNYYIADDGNLDVMRVGTDGTKTPKDAIIDVCRDILMDLDKVNNEFTKELELYNLHKGVAGPDDQSGTGRIRGTPVPLRVDAAGHRHGGRGPGRGRGRLRPVRSAQRHLAVRAERLLVRRPDG